jgi:transposase
MGSYDKIIAIDLGKFKSVCCIADVAAGVHAFETVQTTPQMLRELLVKHRSPGNSRIAVVFETCDTSGWVHDLCTEVGCVALVANPRGEAWHWRRVKRKTDRDDALKLLKLTLNNDLPTVHMPSPDKRQKRRLILHRRSVVARRTTSRNAIRSIYSQQGLQLVGGNKQWTRAGIAELNKDAKPLQECDVLDLWRGRVHVELRLIETLDEQIKILDAKLDSLADEKTELLQTIKGVGPRTAEAVVAYIDDPNRFKNGDHVAGYAGLVPKQIESGEMSRFGHITRRGPGLLRSLLVESAWMVYRCNAWAQLFVASISRGGKGRRKLGIVALARKLLITLWAMLRDNKPFHEPGTRPPRPTPLLTT